MHSNSFEVFRRFGLPFFEAGQKALEVGPDPHWSLRSLLERVGVHYHYADLANGGRTDPTCVAMEDEYHFDCPDGAFDVVLSANVIEHVRKPWTWVPELARITRAGGFVVCVNPVSWPYHEGPVDCWRLFPEAYKALFEEAGLESVFGWHGNLVPIDRHWLPARPPGRHRHHRGRPQGPVRRYDGRRHVPVEAGRSRQDGGHSSRGGSSAMCYPEDKIKEAILHADPAIRERATSYFAYSYSPDPSIMPLVIRAVETHGRLDAFWLVGMPGHLRQTEDTIAWVVDELNQEQTGRHKHYPYALSRILVEADSALLLPRESAILEARHFLPDLLGSFSERLRMLRWDAATCWQKLEEWCEEGQGKIDLGHAHRIVEALCRYGDEFEETVQVLLSDKAHAPSRQQRKWLQLLAVQWAGQARLESAIPRIVALLLEGGGELLHDACAEALTRIGTPAILEAVAEAFPRAGRRFRLYATEPLEYIHSDLAVEKCLYLLEQEKDETIRLNLAHALLSHFAREGIAAARQILLGPPLGFEGRGLRRYLLETCTIMGERFPEYEAWAVAEKADQDQDRKRVQELRGDPTGLMLYAFERFTGVRVVALPRARSPRPAAAHLTRPRKRGAERGVGGNDLCPCGSGKKFGSCCMNTQGGH